MKTKGEKTPNIQTLFCLFIHEEGGESKSFTKRREKENKVSFHVRVSQFIQQDSVIAGFCFWSPLFVY